ncbi:hypothetical protein HYFRA_00012647 [Hymenoscyphus fraxineus]|uniref:t-SNARE coiled-coil homology domain-containing protein n=1 Tax=Hymenoscyphus fraxineus TaxID=746836 RepID=A0A9N9PU68_9HELO|nr:hypothetical protein HYFRA_00012647 [Hymenoscyphus fraxineus]
MSRAQPSRSKLTYTPRFGGSRDPRSALFEGYNAGGAQKTARNGSPSPGGGYGYPSSNGNGSGGLGVGGQSYRPATPNSRGQYSNAVLDELESQNDHQISGMLGKVSMLKDMAIQIGDSTRESSAMIEKMNDSFDNTRVRLRGTMNRMLLMAERTGVSWKVWLLFFAAVGALFFYVWVF